MALERIFYRGGHIDLMHHGAGWRAFVYLPSATMMQTEIPHTNEPTGRNGVIERAHEIMDEALESSA